ncbi:expressed unknown protein [Seminavis robusta]|uniref:Uncharacterized protein n=1 Tax=Seminavis robusta TaxID=568900 RepID=A0A9N8E0R7_9STRA|nr:expressed unknown protein [Seminavis robusta]|eukprot:Sro532_g161470.1 n/a (187) ;mRNA; f:28425-29081
MSEVVSNSTTAAPSSTGEDPEEWSLLFYWGMFIGMFLLSMPLVILILWSCNRQNKKIREHKKREAEKELLHQEQSVQPSGSADKEEDKVECHPDSGTTGGSLQKVEEGKECHPEEQQQQQQQSTTEPAKSTMTFSSVIQGTYSADADDDAAPQSSSTIVITMDGDGQEAVDVEADGGVEMSLQLPS